MSMLALTILLLVCFFHVSIGLFVFLKNPREYTNIWFFGFVLSLLAWLLSNYFSNDMHIAHNVALFINRSIFIFSAAGIYFLYRFSTRFTRTLIEEWFHILLSILALITVIASALPLVVQDIAAKDNIYEVSFGPLSFLYFGFIFVCFIISISVLLKSYIHRKGEERQRLLYVLLSLFLGLVVSLFTNAILPSLFKLYALTALGPISTVIISAGFSYAIIRHRLFDIRLVVARSVAYSLLLVTMAGTYSLAGFGIVGVLFPTHSSSAGQDVVYAFLAVLLAFTFQPLRRFFQRITDGVFYRDHYDAENLLNTLSNIMSREIELERLANKVTWELTSQMKLSKALIVVLDNGEVFYESNADSINHRTISLSELQAVGSGVVVKESLESGSVPELFDKYGLSVSVDLRSTNELVGYLLLGEKKSGDIYNGNDIKTLNIMANELAIAIHNAKSYTQIQNFNRTLQMRIEEATRQLRDANIHLKKLDGIKNEFLSMATHQLNTPLSVIDGYLSMVSDGSHGKVEAQQKEYLEKALHRVRLMKRLVQDFLNVSRMEVGTFAIESTPVDLNKVVGEEVNELGPTAKEKEVLLRFIAPKHPVPVIEIDEQKTRQAVMNLIDNAIYYAPKGEVKVYLDFDDENITFKVVDNGIGVPEDQKAKLFQKFSRADNAKKERPSGTGVGLYLVKQVVEAEGGKIIFESTEGKGSTFGFSLPIKEVPSEKADPQPEPTEEKEESHAPETSEPVMATASTASKEKTTSYYKIIG